MYVCTSLFSIFHTFLFYHLYLRQQKYREKKKSETEKSNVTITQHNTKEEKKIRNKIEKEGDENRSGFKEFKL